MILRLGAILLLLAACVPTTHTVKPLPNFVKVGLAVGDTVTITTNDGNTHEFQISDVRDDALVGAQAEYRLLDITSIKKHSWSRPESPCGGEKPLGCSVPLFIALASESHSHYEDKFYDACAQHDYCYRHGQTTYGADRPSCDAEFLVDMQNLCPNPAVGSLGKVLEVFDDSLDSRATCLSVADDYHAAVRRYGEKRFETTNSTYCEYNGPPLLPFGAPKKPEEPTSF